MYNQKDDEAKKKSLGHTHMQVLQNCHKVYNDKLEIRDPQKLSFEEWKQFTDVCTDFVTRNVMQTVDLTAQMRDVVETIQVCEDTINTFCKKKSFPESSFANVFYKGGNVMRFIVRTFERQQSLPIHELVDSVYRDYFKASDMDFEVSINWDKLMANSTHDGQQDSSRIVNEFSDELFTNLKNLVKSWTASRDKFERKFPFFKYSDHEQSLEKKLLLNDLKQKAYEVQKGKGQENAMEIDILKFGIKSENGVPTSPNRQNMKITSDPGETGFTVCRDFDEEPKVLFCSNNQALSLPKGDGLAHFNLVRVKMVFQVNYHFSNSTSDKSTKKGRKKKLGAEVIDVSIRHKDDTSQNKNVEFIDLSDRPVKQYYEYYFNSTVSFKSYSIPYLILDLTRILFIENEFPFEDTKYEKRIYRIGGLLLCNIMTEESFETNAQRIDKMKSLKLTYAAQESFSEETVNDEFTEQKSKIKQKISSLHQNKKPISIYSFVKQNFDPYKTLSHIKDIYDFLETFNKIIDDNLKILNEIDGKFYLPYSSLLL